MTTYAALRTTLEEAFKTGWGVTTPIAWDNIVENIPDIESPWVRVTIKSRRSSNIVIGEGEPSQLNGFFSVQIFVPMGDGLGAAWAFVDSVNAIMENQQYTGIFTYAADVVNVGEGQKRIIGLETGFHQINVSIPYEAQ